MNTRPDPRPPSNDDDDLSARVRAQRLAAGKSAHITDPTVYGILDGVMADRPSAASDDQKVDRRRRAVNRSRSRVPYP